METPDTLTSESSDEVVTLSCKSGCLLRVPNDSSIEIDSITNELVIKSIDGPINVKKVHGQISLKSIGSFSVATAFSSFNAKHIEGDLFAEQISGNASIQDVDGDVVLKKVHGSLSFSGASPSLEATVYGKASLQLEPEAEGKYSVTSKSNIAYRLEPFTNATINMVSKSGNIRLNIPDNKQVMNVEEYELVIGEGNSVINLEAAGNIEISGGKGNQYEGEFIFDDLGDLTTLADDISQIVTDQIENQMDSISQHISDLTDNLSSIDISTSEKTRRKLESQRRKLERKLASAERTITQKARSAERRIEHKMRTRSRKAASDPVTDEERQKVLEMLQTQQIDVAQAEVLLAALEGRPPEPPPAPRVDPVEPVEPNEPAPVEPAEPVEPIDPNPPVNGEVVDEK